MLNRFACFFFSLLTGVPAAYPQTVTGPGGEVFTVRVLKDGLSDPWEVTYGPDGFLWLTESKSYAVSRLNPVTGEKTGLLSLRNARNFPRYDLIPDEQDGGKPWPQGGLMGLAIHPQLLRGKPFVYLVYVYQYEGAGRAGDGGRARFGGHLFRSRLVRFEYDRATQKLTDAAVLCDTVPSSSDHNSGRLLIAPVDGKPYLFLTVGDMGAGQFANAGRPNHAQQINVYEGKVLRFNLEPDGDVAPGEQWIPNDNPFNTARQNAVWSYGHRNAQGLDAALVGGGVKIYTSEHGPFSEDEVNLIEKGKNYGHPLVIGYTDGNYNGFAAGVTNHPELPGVWHTTYPLITSESENVRRIGPANYREPLRSLYPIPGDSLKAIFTKTVNDDPNKPDWTAEAPSSIAVYTHDAIPGWKNSLLIPTLKTGRLVRLQLSADGNRVVGDTLTYFKAPLRYRDIALSPDGRKLFLAVDSSAVTSGPSKENPKGTTCRGCILEFTYQGPARSAQPALPASDRSAPRLRKKKN